MKLFGRGKGNTIEKEIYCRVGKDWRTGRLFVVGNPLDLETEILRVVVKKLNIDGESYII